ncbi:MAG: virulence factor BrkB family protein [Idiomarina sp.]
MDVTRLQLYATNSWRFLRYFVRRCAQDKISVTAGHLTYVSSLALVPLIAVMFSGFAAFPMFADMREEIQSMIVTNLIPTSSEAINGYINEFAGNASQMTTIGVVFLVVVAIMLLMTIDTAINRIWRNYQRRRLPIAIAIYWMLLTLGPVLMGSGLAISSYVVSLASVADTYVSGLQSAILTIVPYITSILAFLLLYVLMPNRVVRIKHAIWGALLATVLFELGKYGFTEYITRFPSYEAIYGALATIPILLVWMYLSWNIVLLGAELTASIEEFNERKKPGTNHLSTD